MFPATRMLIIFGGLAVAGLLSFLAGVYSVTGRPEDPYPGPPSKGLRRRRP